MHGWTQHNQSAAAVGVSTHHIDRVQSRHGHMKATNAKEGHPHPLSGLPAACEGQQASRPRVTGGWDATSIADLVVLVYL